MVKRIQAEIKASPFTWIGKKVKAYQDNDKKYDKLDSWGKANVVADEIAKKDLKQVKNQPRQMYHAKKSEGWTILLNKTIVATKFEKKIIAHCTEKDSKQYWYKQMGIPEVIQAHMDWTTFMKITSALSSQFHSKALSRYCSDRKKYGSKEGKEYK